MKDNSFFVLKNFDNNMYFVDNDLFNCYYSSNIFDALRFLDLENLKGFLSYLRDNFGVLNLQCVKVLLKEYKFICSY